MVKKSKDMWVAAFSRAALGPAEGGKGRAIHDKIDPTNVLLLGTKPRASMGCMSMRPEGRLRTFWHGQGDGQLQVT
jgi:hypothetical protein